MFDYRNTTQENLDNHIDHICEIADDIQLHKITILTGSNATGKSVIRKLMPMRVVEKLKAEGVENPNPDKVVSSISMQLRTESRTDWYALCSVMHDMPEASTGDSTFGLINGLMGAHDRFIVIDEPEIGMGREMVAGLAKYINERLSEFLNKNYGVLIITHSADIVSNINHDSFVNIDGMTEDEWLNRKIEPVNPVDVNKWSTELSRAIQKRMK